MVGNCYIETFLLSGKICLNYNETCGDLRLLYCVSVNYVGSVLFRENFFITNLPLKDLLFLCSL